MADQDPETQTEVTDQEQGAAPDESEALQEQVEAADQNQSNNAEEVAVAAETAANENTEADQGEAQEAEQAVDANAEDAQETEALADTNNSALDEGDEQQENQKASVEDVDQPQDQSETSQEQPETSQEVTEEQTEASPEQKTGDQQAEVADEITEEATSGADQAPAEPAPEEQADVPAETASTKQDEAPDAGEEKAKEEQAEAPEEGKAEDSTEKEEDAAPEQAEVKEVEQAAAEDEAQAAPQEEKPAEEGPPEEAPPSPEMVGTDVQEPTLDGQKEELSPRKPDVNLEATATVKFVLMPSGQVVTVAFTLGQTLGELKAHFATELKMPSNLIMLLFDGKGMTESTTLADLGVGPNGTVQLEMQSADPVNNPLKPYRPRQEYHMPDVITVRVMTEDCEAKDVVVEIERSRTKKPFLGGFRHKTTGVEYHNASAQTMKKPRPPPTTERYCRDTQTCQQRNIRQQTTNTTSTQMTGIGIYISNAEDKLITPGKYFTADEHWAMILRNVIILQKYYRRWLAKRYVQKLKEDKAKRLEWEREEEMRKKKEKEERIKRDYARRINPKTKADFDMLIHCLEKWRQEEMERINSTLTGAERKAAMCMLLDQETELLSAIERHKNEANTDNKEKRIMAFLDKAAAPKKWQGHDGNLTYMDTPYTIRAKELRDIYNSINMKYLTQDERLDVLLTLKHTVKEHDCKLTQEIIELIDREADLLMRGVKEGNLTGLRKRISTLFLQYIKTPIFNPEAAKLLKVPQDPSMLRKDINYCHSCGSYLPSTEFFITSNSKEVGRCRKCQKIENDGRQREDHTYFKIMLKALRKSEEAMQDGSSICYLLQENDLRYLVENIWSNQSILSAWNDLYDLVLVRWDKRQEWSPWNCILLTHDEAEAHKKLFNLEEGYGHVFIHKVTQKHNFARNYFSRLPGMAEVLRQKIGSRDLETKIGPSVAGHSVPKAQKV